MVCLVQWAVRRRKQNMQRKLEDSLRWKTPPGKFGSRFETDLRERESAYLQFTDCFELVAHVPRVLLNIGPLQLIIRVKRNI